MPGTCPGVGIFLLREGVESQLYADNLKCVPWDPALLLRAARFATGYVRLVGQEPAPRKCVLLNTSKAVGRDMKDWVLSEEGDKWSVKYDLRGLGGHLDTTFRDWSATLAARVRLVLSGLVLIFALPLDLHGRIRVGSGQSTFRLPCMVLKPLCLLLRACVSFGRLFTGLFGLVVNLWLVLVLFLV